jgi:hypothetical protein
MALVLDYLPSQPRRSRVHALDWNAILLSLDVPLAIQEMGENDVTFLNLFSGLPIQAQLQYSTGSDRFLLQLIPQ